MEQRNLQDIAKEILALLEERKDATNTKSIDKALTQKAGTLSILAEEKLQNGEEAQKILEEIYPILGKESLFNINCFSFINNLAKIRTTYAKVINAS